MRSTCGKSIMVRLSVLGVKSRPLLPLPVIERAVKSPLHGPPRGVHQIPSNPYRKRRQIPGVCTGGCFWLVHYVWKLALNSISRLGETRPEQEWSNGTEFSVYSDFPEFLGQPREVHPKFRNEIPENDCSIRSPSRNFRNFWVNGKRPRLPSKRVSDVILY